MATSVLADGAAQLLPGRDAADRATWVTTFGTGLRQLLLAYRDGARMVAGTRLTHLEHLRTVERIAARLVDTGFTVRQATVLLSTVYNYTISFVTEEQAVFPRPGERSEAYDIGRRSAALKEAGLPLLRRERPVRPS